MTTETSKTIALIVDLDDADYGREVLTALRFMRSGIVTNDAWADCEPKYGPVMLALGPVELDEDAATVVRFILGDAEGLYSERTGPPDDVPDIIAAFERVLAARLRSRVSESDRLRASAAIPLTRIPGA